MGLRLFLCQGNDLKVFLIDCGGLGGLLEGWLGLDFGLDEVNKSDDEEFEDFDEFDQKNEVDACSYRMLCDRIGERVIWWNEMDQGNCSKK